MTFLVSDGIVVEHVEELEELEEEDMEDLVFIIMILSVVVVVASASERIDFVRVHGEMFLYSHRLKFLLEPLAQAVFDLFKKITSRSSIHVRPIRDQKRTGARLFLRVIQSSRPAVNFGEVKIQHTLDQKISVLTN